MSNLKESMDFIKRSAIDPFKRYVKDDPYRDYPTTISDESSAAKFINGFDKLMDRSILTHVYGSGATQSLDAAITALNRHPLRNQLLANP